MRRKMKNYLRELVLLLVLFGLLVYFMFPKFLAAQNINDEAHFPDAEFRSVVENFMNVEPGGRFSAFEAERKTGIFRLYAADVRGMHYFKSMTEFSCVGKSVTKLDLSNCTELIDINISGVPLEELILPESDKLRNIYLSKTKLRRLDVSRCPNLYRFTCCNSLLSSVDVSHNPKLFDLRVNLNQIQQIDLTKNPDLYTLDCASNRLVDLDLSKNLELRNLWCDGNPLNKLEIDRLLHLSGLTIDGNQTDLVDSSQKNPSLHVTLKTVSERP